MITKTEWQAFRDANKIKAKAEEHITEALKEIFIIYGGKLSCWYYPGADEGGMGEMQIYSDSIQTVVEGTGSFEATYEDQSEDYYGSLTNDFPVHFLFLSIPEIKKRVKAFKAKEEKREAAAEAKKTKATQARKAKKDKLVKAATKKLSTEERKALGI